MLLQNKVILGIWEETKASVHVYEARISFHQTKEQEGILGSMYFAFTVVSCKAPLGKPCHSRPLMSGLREETIRVMDILISFEQNISLICVLWPQSYFFPSWEQQFAVTRVHLEN